MRKYIIFSIVALCWLASCSSEDNHRIHRWTTKNDISDLSIYRGSSTKGAIPVPIENDSVRKVIMDTVFFGVYNDRKYDSFSCEIEGNGRVTYIDPIRQRQIVSTYNFRNDSLYIDLSDGTELFVAKGNMDSLYIEESYCRYRKAGAEVGTFKDTIVQHPSPLNLQTVLNLAGFASANDMKLAADTVRWCNVKFVFKR